MQDSFQDSESRHRSIVDTMLDGVISITEQGLIQDFNKAAERIFGYRAEEVHGQNIKMLMPEPYHLEHDTYLDNYRDTGTAKIIGVGREVTGKRKDGTMIDIHLSIGEMEAAGQRMYSGILRDITLQKGAERATRRNTEAVQNLYSLSTQAELKLEDKLLACLRLGCELFAMPVGLINRVEEGSCRLEYVIGPEGSPTPGTELNLAATFCQQTWSEVQAVGRGSADDHVAQDDPCYVEYGLRSYLGSPLFVRGQLYGTLNFTSPEHRADQFKPQDLAIVRLFGEWAGNEITRQLTEAELSERAESLRSILDTVVDGIITVDGKARVRSINPAVTRIFGYQAEEIVGKSIRLLMAGSHMDKGNTDLLDFLLSAMEGDVNVGQEIEGRRKYGDTFPMEMAVSEMDTEGGRMFTAIMRDITERKKIERVKNQFISTVSHELRTPLTSIRGALGVVLGKEMDTLSERAKKMLETANRNSERLTFLINDILDLEKIEAGEMEFHLQPLDINIIAHRAITENEAYADSYLVSLKLNILSDESLFVMGDEHRLLQVFANLLSNAVKYSPTNGTVVVEIEALEGQVRVGVRDQGSGIPDAFHSQIFSRFAQADSSDSREKGGTGLGLAISKAIVEMHEGEIHFTSIVDVGTEFYFELPQWHDVVRSTREGADLPRALICEDNRDIAYILASLLEDEGLRCDIASTGEAARRLLLEQSYRLLLLDLILPDIDGITLLRELRENEPTSKLPVIVVSATANEGLARSGDVGLSVIDWLQKPIDNQRLSDALLQALHGDRSYKILHIEDDLDVIQVVSEMISGFCDYDYVTTLQSARERLKSHDYDLVILDLTLPDGRGVELLDQLAERVPVVIFSGEDVTADIASHVDAALTKARASSDQLITTVKRVLNQQVEIQ